MPLVRRLFWDVGNAEHVAQHGVAKAEVEEFRRNNPLLTRSGPRRIRGIGQTDAGRYLTVFLDDMSAGLYYVVTARDSTDAERRRFRATRGRS